VTLEYFAKHREGGHTVIPDSLHSLKIVRDVTYKSFWRFVMFRDSSMTESPKTVTEPSRNRHGTVTEPSRNRHGTVTEPSRTRHGPSRNITERHGTVTVVTEPSRNITEQSRNISRHVSTKSRNRHGKSRNVTEPSRKITERHGRHGTVRTKFSCDGSWHSRVSLIIH
jgi:ribosomal protein L35AE/L33A